MAVRIKFDNNHVPQRPTFVLANRNGNKLGCIPAMNINFSDKFNGASELQFKVYKEENGIQCELWDEIIDFRLIWCPEWDQWYEIHVELTEADSVIKNISATSVGEAELSQINLYNIEINTKDDIARDDYEVTVLYNSTNPKASLLDRITDKAPHYHIGHVDDTIASIQRTFQFDDISILDALYEIGEEIQCVFIIDSGTTPDGRIARTINAYDLQSKCNNCGHRDAFVGVCPKCGSSDINTGYGQDTNIFISKENLTDEINYTSNTDSVKNCFRLVGGDDLMTATIANCNPNGGGYLWYFTDDMKEDMSDALRTKLSQYETEYNTYVNLHEFIIDSRILSDYNTLVNKYKFYKSSLNTISNPIVGYSKLMEAYYDTIDFEMLLRYDLMPSVEISGTTAAQEVAKLTSAALSPVAVVNPLSASASTVSSAVLYIAKQIVRSDYQVKVENGRLNDNVTWTGRFVVANYSDDTDTATSGDISVSVTGDTKTYLEQRINKSLANSRDDITDIISLFKLDLDSFTNQLSNYGLSSLNIIRDCCQSCLDILMQQIGITDENPSIDPPTQIYTSMYLPYYNKYNAITAEVALREQEIATIYGTFDENSGILKDGMQTAIQAINKQVQDHLDFEKYIGSDLVNELATYRREDTYENDNFISDGFDNQEIFEKALEFIELAKVEIFKSATLQHSISSTLKNLLVMKEFSTITNLFEVGNWLCVQVSNKTYRLRLSSYEIDYENIENINVNFSDVVQTMFGDNDIESVLKSASSMSSSFGNVKRQARRGDQSQATLTEYKEKGLALTQMKIISDAENQNVTMDYHGLLCREKVPFNEEYDDHQLKIINKGLYLTDDAWKTSRAGIGEFIYYDPDDGNYKTKYGVVADMLIAPLILSEDVGVYNLNNTIRLNKNGLTIVSNGNNTDPTIFKIQRKKTVDGEEIIEDVIWFDTNGNAHFNGTLSLQSIVGSTKTVSEVLNDITTANSNARSAQSAAGTANSNASQAITVANTANSNAGQAITTANQALSNVTALNNALDQEEIFNRLTNNGESQGLFFDSSDGLLYINANYIKTGYISASKIKGDVLILGGNNNIDGYIRMNDASGNSIGTWNNNGIRVDIDSTGNQYAIFNSNGFNLHLYNNSEVFTSDTDVGSRIKDDRSVEVNTGSLVFKNGDESQNTDFWRTYISSSNIHMFKNWHSSDGSMGSNAWDFCVNPCGLRFITQRFSKYDYLDVNFPYTYEDYAYGDSPFLMEFTGDLYIHGTKSRVVSTDQYSNRLLYCYETPSPLFGDVGEGTIGEDGKCYIWLDAVFAQTVSTDQYQVFLQRYGPGDCYILERSNCYFVVRGVPGLSFGWEIKAKQRGYDQKRLEKPSNPDGILTTHNYGKDAAQYYEELQKGRINE